MAKVWSSRQVKAGAVVIIVVISFMITWVVLRSQPTQSLRESLSLSKQTINFGSALEGSELRGSFDIENKSAFSITINNVKPSCSCTATETEIPFTIPAYSTRSVKLKVSTDGKVGQLDSQVYIAARRGAESEVFPISIVAFSQPLIKVTGEQFDFGRLAINETKSKKQ